MIATLLTVMRKELRETFRDRRTLVSSRLMGPLLGPLMLVGAMQLSLERSLDSVDEPVPLTVSGAGYAPELLGFLRERGVSVTPREGTPDDIARWVSGDKDLVVLELREGFGAALLAGKPARLSLHADRSSSTANRHADRVRRNVQAWSSRMASARLQLRGVSPALMQPVLIDDVDLSTPSSRATLILGVLSYMVLLVMLSGGFYLAIDATAGERERGSLEPLLSLPVPRERLIQGKVLATVLMMSLALALMLAVLALSLRRLPLEEIGMSVDFGPAMAVAVFGAMVPFTLVGAALLTVVASFTRSYKEAQTWLGMVLLVPTLPIAVAGVMEVEPSAALMAVPSLSQHLLMQGLLRGEPLPATYALISVASTLALGVALTWLAGRLYLRERILG
ncbi:MAG: ABC transporter permease [Gammaproteobacteria bacterium]